MKSLFILQLVCCVITAMLALQLVMASLQVRWKVALRNIKMDSRCIHAILLRPLPLTDASWTPCTRYRCGRSIQHIVLYPSGICHHSLHNQHREHRQQSATVLFTWYDGIHTHRHSFRHWHVQKSKFTHWQYALCDARSFCG